MLMILETAGDNDLPRQYTLVGLVLTFHSWFYSQILNAAGAMRSSGKQLPEFSFSSISFL